MSRVVQCAQEAGAGRLSTAPLDPWRQRHAWRHQALIIPKNDGYFWKVRVPSVTPVRRAVEGCM